MLAEVAQRAATEIEPEMYIGIDDISVYCLTPDIELLLYMLRTPNNYNLADKLQPYLAHQLTMPLFHETVAMFRKRVDSLPEVRQQAVVTISVKDGSTVLDFSEVVGASEEHYEVTDAPRISVPRNPHRGAAAAKALAHATKLVFDYVEQHVLVLRGPDEFIFGITGRY